MHRSVFPAALLAALAACAPTARPATAPAAAAETVTPTVVSQTAAAGTMMRDLRTIPATAAYRQALERGTRSASGAPGARYWQNRVRYRIDAELDPATALLRGSQQVTLYNRSPERLDSVLLNLYQNVFSATVPRNRTIPAMTGGVTLERVVAQGQTLADRTTATGTAPGYRVRGTLGWVTLPRPVAPGDSVTLEIAWRHTVPPRGTFRTAWEEALGGRAFQVAQWYPQVATFDDVRGWDATPYLGDGEFYLEYGDWDVSLTVPANHLVGASGTLQNPAEVLTPEALSRLAAATAGEATAPVVTRADVEARRATLPGRDGRVTWRFRAENVRDFAFATSDRYVWDATRAVVPVEEGGTRAVAVHALYRPGAPGWEQAARYGQHATQLFSREVVGYPYPQVTVAEGSVGGMEYPMLVFIGKPSTAAALQSVIGHEVGHQWWPMMVGSDEAAFAWMDEGITESYEDRAQADFFPGTDPYAETREGYLRVAGRDNEVPVSRHTDLVSPYGARTVAAYTKPAVLLRSLRAVLGAATFDRVMRTYTREWAFKHPYPWDFFATAERVSGQQLDWFFYPWWYTTGVLDQAVEGVREGGGSVRVTVRDRGDVAMPVRLRVTTADGRAMMAVAPVSAWLDTGKRTVEITVPTGAAVTRVEIDPESLFPDVDRANNVWTAPAAR